RGRNPDADRPRAFVRLGEEPRDLPAASIARAQDLAVQSLRPAPRSAQGDRSDDVRVSGMGPAREREARRRGRGRPPPGTVRPHLSVGETISAGIPGESDSGEHHGHGRVPCEVGACRDRSLTRRSKGSRRAWRRAADGRRRIVQVLVMEAGPVVEGRTMAKVLEADGVPATVIPDDGGVLRVADATYVLTGADSVLRDGSVVNKRGTRALAEAAAKHGKPMYVACETLKFDARFDATSWPGPRVGSLFDMTPGPLVTTVVTERGTYAPEIIRTLLAPSRTSS